MRLDGLTDFQQDLLNTSKKIHKEIPKVLRKVGSKGRTHVAKKSRQLVKKKTGNYHKKWKRGKVFKSNDEFVVRIYNSSSHAHLLEDGHIMITKDGRNVGFVRGKHVLKDGMQEFESSGVVDEMIGDWLDDLLERNRL